jgi:hypothetical protein
MIAKCQLATQSLGGNLAYAEIRDGNRSVAGPGEPPLIGSQFDGAL